MVSGNFKGLSDGDIGNNASKECDETFSKKTAKHSLEKLSELHKEEVGLISHMYRTYKHCETQVEFLNFILD